MASERDAKRLRRTAMITNASLQTRQVQDGAPSALRQPSLLGQMQRSTTATQPSVLSLLEGRSLDSTGSSCWSKKYLSDLLGSAHSGCMNIPMLTNVPVVDNANQMRINIAAKVQELYPPRGRFPPVTQGECSHYLPPSLDHSFLEAHALPLISPWITVQSSPCVDSTSVVHKRKFSPAKPKGKSPYYAPPSLHHGLIEAHGSPPTPLWSNGTNSPCVNSTPEIPKTHARMGLTRFGPSRIAHASPAMDASGEFEMREEDMLPCLLCRHVQPPTVVCVQDDGGVVHAELDFWVACAVCSGLYHMHCLGFSSFQDLPLAALFSPHGYKCCFC